MVAGAESSQGSAGPFMYIRDGSLLWLVVLPPAGCVLLELFRRTLICGLYMSLGMLSIAVGSKYPRLDILRDLLM